MLVSRPSCPKSSPRGRRSRRGVMSMELVLTLPILMTVLFGLFEFTLLFYARSLVVEASRTGARHASLPGATSADVEQAVRAVLNPRLQRQLDIDIDLGRRSGDVVMVGVSIPMSEASPDLLWMTGFSLTNQTIYSETRMVRE